MRRYILPNPNSFPRRAAFVAGRFSYTPVQPPVSGQQQSQPSLQQQLQPSAPTQQPSPPLVTVEVKKHDVTFYLTCDAPNCTGTNCADGSLANNCKFGSRPESALEQKEIPQDIETHIVGNLTSKVPPNKQGIIVDTNINFAGQAKAQGMVLENPPVKVDPLDLNINPASTQFVQEPSHHNAIVKTFNPHKLP